MPRRADPIDAHVAQRLRARRELVGLTQEKLGRAVGVTFQMIQKYENGNSRVGASRLMKIAKVLEVPVAWFFDGFNAGHHQPMLAQPTPTLDENLFNKRETMELLKAYYDLPETLRKHVMAMVQGLKTGMKETPPAAQGQAERA